MSLLFGFFLLLFGFQTLKAQHRIHLSNIDIIAYDTDDTEIGMFEKVGSNSYVYTIIEFTETTEGFLETLVTQESDEPYTMEDIKETYAHLVFVSDIQTIDTTSWQQYDWFVQTEDTSEKAVNILRFMGNGLALYEELLFQETSNAVNSSNWQVDDAIWLEVVVLDFGNGKEITLLNEEDDIIFFGIPLYNQIVMVSNEIDIDFITSVERNRYPVDDYEILSYLEPDYMHKIVKDETEQYRLYDNFKNDLLQQSFDTIMCSNYFIVGQKDATYTIYNSIRTKFETPNVQKAYFHDNYVEFLTAETSAYVDIYGNQFQKLPQKVLNVCGTVSSISHQISKNEDQKYPYSVKVMHRNIGPQGDTEQTYIFKNHKKDEELTFINDTTSDYSDENDEFTGAISGFPNYIKVFNGRKYGLYSYDKIHHDKTLKTTVSDQYSLKRNVYNDLLVTTIQELPVKYDRITINQDNLILIYKNDKVGIFPQQKKSTYQLLERVTSSFYKIVKNGKTGWLDIKTMKEYF
ncbi:hypothetical protein [Kordia jejudonensis]|uniref:hypothetical protein n=1 Tax=Kordia jejudonensis TaxID=1348245 RepID=UPI00138DDB84|nr:hypothetical protein [Kordia jejudonensis]